MRSKVMDKLLVLLLTLWATSLLAQTDEDEAPAEEPAQNEQAAETPEPATDPFDYESSEQISEDLSVSFPVDI